jgi:dihydrofolate synthase/folylpolyglutamate synthase
LENVGSGRAYLQTLAQWRGDANFSLENIKKVLHKLGNPQDAVPVIHVAGTNGKGSVSAFCAGILGAAGKKVGLTISPHLSDLTERIIINGLPISESVLDELTPHLRVAIESADVRLSFHEGITALAFLAFRELGLDYGVVEVGLGGRLDSTNVITRPEVAIITSIGFDHCHILGNTLAEIAREKAGIIKVNSVTVVGELLDEALKQIVNIAMSKRSQLFIFDRDFYAKTRDDQVEIVLSDEERLTTKLALQGVHQQKNAAVAAYATHTIGIDKQSISLGLSRVFWPGRFEEVELPNGRIILDCAHNPNGIDTFIATLNLTQHVIPNAIGFGCLDTKDWRGMIDRLVAYAPSAEWLIGEPESSQSVSSEIIEEYLSGFGIRATSFKARYQDLASALCAAASRQSQRVGNNNKGLAVLAGSIYLLGKVRPYFVSYNRLIW